MKSLIVLVLLLCCTVALADPWAVSDPQCRYNGVNDCAAGYEVSSDGQSWQAAGSADVGTDQIRLEHDLAGTSFGAHEFRFRAVNPWGHSSDVPFAFAAGVPLPPAGITTVAQP